MALTNSPASAEVSSWHATETSAFTVLACSAVEENVLLKPMVHKISKNLGTPEKYGRLYGDMKQVHFRVSTNIRRHCMKCQRPGDRAPGIFIPLAQTGTGTKTSNRCLKKLLRIEYLVLMFSDVSVFFSLVNYIDICVIFLVSCVLELVFLPEEGSSLLPKRNVLFCVFL